MAFPPPIPEEPATAMLPKRCPCRVGAWRLLDLLKQLDLPCSLLCNSNVVKQAPGVVKAYLEAGAELVGHGLTNSERQVCWQLACSMSLQSFHVHVFCSLSYPMTSCRNLSCQCWMPGACSPPHMAHHKVQPACRLQPTPACRLT